VRSLLQQVERVAHEHGSKSVIQIEVAVGPLSGVEPLLVRHAFDRLADGSTCAGAELLIQEVRLLACCRSCRAEFAMENFQFQCPDCGSRSIRITQGDKFRLLNVSLELSEPVDSTV
jgi:hydrogenase nickel incorporation protein HypA/HybF